MTSTSRWKLAAAALVALQACNCEGCPGEILTPTPDQTVQTDEFCQRPAAKVDILWVVDNSGSMTAEQNKVADRFFEFFRQLRVSLVDYHIGVITTSLQEGIQEEANGVLRRYQGPAVAGCDGCRWLTRDVDCPNSDVARLEGESTTAYETRLQTECPAALVFRKLVTVGNQGSAFEQGLGASAMALGALIDPDTGTYRTQNGQRIIPEANLGFLRQRTGTCTPPTSTGQAGLDCARDDAENCAEPTLYVVYVSDEQDRSDGPPRYYYRILEGLKGAGNEAKVSTSVITGWPSNASVSIDEACDILRNSYDSDPSNDGRLGELQDILRQEDFVCTDPSDPTAPVENRSSRLGSRYIDVVCRTGGVVADLCSAEYSTALNRLGADAAGLARKYILSNWDNADWGQDGIPLTSDESEVARIVNCDGDPAVAGPNDLSICVHATPLGGNAEQLVPRSETEGWRLEPSTRSIRFDGTFIPKPGTKVTIIYPLKLQQ